MAKSSTRRRGQRVDVNRNTKPVTTSTHSASSRLTWICSVAAVVGVVWLTLGRPNSISESQEQLHAARFTPLMRAARDGDVAVVKQFLTLINTTEGAAKFGGVNEEDPSGKPAILHALEARHHYIMQAVTHSDIGRDMEGIVQALADSQGFDGSVNCPSYYALQYRNLPGLRALSTPKNSVALLECVRELDAYNETMVHIASRSKTAGFTRLFAVLLKQIEQNGEKISKNPVLDILGVTPATALTSVAMAKAISVDDLDIILKYCTSEDVNRVGWAQNTPLHISAMSGNIQAARSLVKNGANLNPLNALGSTPFHIASSLGFTGMADVLLELGADASITDSSGRVHSALEPMVGPVLPAQLEASTGGWYHQRDGEDVESGCSIDRRHLSEITTEELYSKYVFPRKPVMITGFHEKRPAVATFQKHKFLEKFGNLTLQVGKVPYGDLYGIKSTRKTISARSFVNELMVNTNGTYTVHEGIGMNPEYVFDPQILWKSPELDAQVPFPSVFGDVNVILKQFILGPRHSGAYPHFHNAAVNSLVYGRKRWFLFPPGDAFFSIKHVNDWVTTDLPKLRQRQQQQQQHQQQQQQQKQQQQQQQQRRRHGEEEEPVTMFECVQGPGDVMFVPDMWGHAVLNEEDSIAVAYEFHE